MNYILDEWKVSEDSFNAESNYVDETIFAIGNGYVGVRGNFEEGYSGAEDSTLEDSTLEGTYINGFFETEGIQYGELAYGYAKNNQTMLNVINGKVIELYIEDEKFSMTTGEIIDYKRSIDMKNGVMTRWIIWKSPLGKEVEINITRLASFEDKHLISIHYEVTALNFHGKITLVSALDGNIKNKESTDDPRIGAKFNGEVLKLIKEEQENGFGAFIYKTNNTKFFLACGMENVMESKNKYEIFNRKSSKRLESVFILDIKKGVKVVLDKYISYHTSIDNTEGELMLKTTQVLEGAKAKGFREIAEFQKNYMENFWGTADIEIKGELSLQQGIRFNLFHLLQSVGKDGNTNIAAKGLTGEGYEGHYFWDTEIFSLPFFTYTVPAISKKLVEYRYNTLDKARERAREMGHEKGALYPWRTINGEECSAYYPAGTAQYHINADIIYALKKYMEATNDKEFMLNFGAEMVFETARLWADLGNYDSKRENKFCINCVTGPDEYTAIVNNNCYTNYMAQLNLQYAVDIALWLKDKHNIAYEKIKVRIALEDEEILSFEKAAKNMYLPYDEELKIHPQDDSFLHKKIWDFENTPKEKHPLLLHFHPLVIYRHQVCKQADVVLTEFLFGNEFTLEDKKRDYDYYEPLTTHDSSLSTCIYSVMASEIGYREKAYDYFMTTVRMDLDDNQNNTQHGVHTACMAGAWMCMVNGFAGMRVYDGVLNFKPYLPANWDSYKFKISFNGSVLCVEVDGKAVNYKLDKGNELEFIHEGALIKIRKDKQISFVGRRILLD